jgi:hypothetical protein
MTLKFRQPLNPPKGTLKLDLIDKEVSETLPLKSFLLESSNYLYRVKELQATTSLNLRGDLLNFVNYLKKNYLFLAPFL